MSDTRLAPYGALLLRVTLDTMFLAHAWLKLVVFTAPVFAGFLGQVGLPVWPSWPRSRWSTRWWATAPWRCARSICRSAWPAGLSRRLREMPDVRDGAA